MTSLPRRWCCVAVLGIGATVSGYAQAQATAAAPSLELRSLAATCAACHGTDGRAVQGAALVGLRGRSERDLATQLQAFRDGSREGTVMPQIAKGYTPAQLAQLAAYFAALPP